AEEGRRIKSVRGGGVALTRVPTVRQRAGDFSEFAVTIVDPLTGLPFAGNIIPASRIDPIATTLLKRFPAPNADPTALGGNRNFSTATPQIRNFREELPRVDWHVSSKNLVYARLINETI